MKLKRFDATTGEHNGYVFLVQTELDRARVSPGGEVDVRFSQGTVMGPFKGELDDEIALGYPWDGDLNFVQTTGEVDYFGATGLLGVIINAPVEALSDEASVTFVRRSGQIETLVGKFLAEGE